MPSIKGGGAMPATKRTSGTVHAGPAKAVWGYPSAAAAIAAGHKLVGGPATPVFVVTAGQLRANGGVYVVEGEGDPVPMYTASAGAQVAGDNAIPVYLIGGSL